MINKNIKHCSRDNSFGAVFAERFNKSIRDLPKGPVFERVDGNWIDNLQTITKQNKNRVHISARIKRIQASLKKNEGFVYQIFQDKRKKNKPKFQVNDLVRVAVLKRTFSKGDTTKTSYKIYKITENFRDTIASYKINKFPEKHKKFTRKDKFNTERK